MSILMLKCCLETFGTSVTAQLGSMYIDLSMTLFTEQGTSSWWGQVPVAVTDGSVREGHIHALYVLVSLLCMRV